ncbi:cytochrome c1 [Sphingomonas sp. 28-63-12]|uniref:cytochrome c1 n=1 Tax=Sphingomonas sp. 28-63-12 TaxID=1970434 RepID=UPI000BD7945A|nr:MAG: cytochrome c1 [Sphingomonas sp. 28-63-12]
MVRIISSLVGLAFVFVLGLALYSSVSGVITDPTPATAIEEFHRHPKEVAFASDGMMGKFDRAQLQRGLQVYKEVCSACHSLTHVAFRDLTKLGYSDAQVKKFAADWGTKASVKDPKTGDVTERPNLPADHFPKVYYPGQGNPPDLSLITKARHDGPAYVYSLLTGYAEQPAELLKKFPDSKTPDGLYYNPYFSNLNIAMPAPLADGAVTYSDGTKNSLNQEAKDIAAFLEWAAEPELEQRHALGFVVLGFLLVGTGLAYGSYRTIWRNVKH